MHTLIRFSSPRTSRRMFSRWRRTMSAASASPAQLTGLVQPWTTNVPSAHTAVPASEPTDEIRVAPYAASVGDDAGERGPGREHEEDAEPGGDPLAALEPEPDREEVAARTRRARRAPSRPPRRGAPGEERARDEDRHDRLQRVEEEHGDARSSCRRRARRWSRRCSPTRRCARPPRARPARARRRTGSSRTGSRRRRGRGRARCRVTTPISRTMSQAQLPRSATSPSATAPRASRGDGTGRGAPSAARARSSAA